MRKLVIVLFLSIPILILCFHNEILDLLLKSSFDDYDPRSLRDFIVLDGDSINLGDGFKVSTNTYLDENGAESYRIFDTKDYIITLTIGNFNCDSLSKSSTIDFFTEWISQNSNFKKESKLAFHSIGQDSIYTFNDSTAKLDSTDCFLYYIIPSRCMYGSYLHAAGDHDNILDLFELILYKESEVEVSDLGYVNAISM